jgi:hypothetical protein
LSNRPKVAIDFIGETFPMSNPPTASPEMENPAALAGANRVLEVEAFESNNSHNSTETTAEFQASVIIANRFRLSPVRARLICDLAGIGRAAA